VRDKLKTLEYSHYIHSILPKTLKMSIIQPKAFATWFKNFSHLAPDYEEKENNDMETIINFVATPSKNPLAHLSVALHHGVKKDYSWALTHP
jgi:hypothetical protein